MKTDFAISRKGKQYYEYLLAYNTGAAECVKTLENMISNERVKYCRNPPISPPKTRNFGNLPPKQL